MTRLRQARPDHVAVATILAGIAGTVVLALVLPGVGLKFVGAIVGIAITYAITTPVRRLRMERAVKKYRDFVAQDPIRLFANPPRVDPAGLQSRPRLTASVADELKVQKRDPEPRPILVVGEAGSGKTTFAAGLAAKLARSGEVPVIVPLRGRGDEIDFRAAAGDRFKELVNLHQLGRGAEALWEYLVRGHRCVVIADGLDERVLDSRAGRVTEATREILTSESARSIPLVVTSRPDGLPESQARQALWLEDLPESYVSSLLVADCKNSLSEHEAREITRRLELTLRPLFLTVARDIGAKAAASNGGIGADGRARTALLSSFAAAEDADLARYRLLDARLDVFMSDDAGLRSRTVNAVSLLALIALREGDARASTADQSGTYEAWLQAITGPALNRRAALKPALELHFLRIDGETVRFLHPIIQTYLASRGMELVRRAGLADPEWGPLLDVGATDEVLRALRMYATRLALAGGAAEEERVGLLMRDLVRYPQSSVLEPSQRLALLATAAHALGSAAAARPGALEKERAELADLIAGTWDTQCKEPTKVEATKWLARMSGEAAFRSVWKIGLEDDTYAFRWEVVEALAESAVAATAALSGYVEPMLEVCSSWTADPQAPDDQLPEGRVRDLGLVAKFLPSGNEAAAETSAAGLDSPVAAGLTGRLAEVVRAMAARDRALGVEASLAQGLKHAARRYPLTDANLSEAEKLASGARFWYTRIMAIHALVRHAIAVEDKRLEEEMPHDAVNRIDQAVSGSLEDEHPWVREAAAQGRSALDHVRRRETDPARGFVWHDEASQIARSSYELDEAASRLLGEVALVLNLNEQGEHGVSQGGRFVKHPDDQTRVAGCAMCEHQLEVGTSNALPHCLSLDPDRSRVLGSGQGCTCSFRLCPYDFGAYRTVRLAHRGPMSPKFCAAQRAIARNLGPPPWQRELSVDSYSDFWAKMEERA